jgi:hypothetical protein
LNVHAGGEAATVVTIFSGGRNRIAETSRPLQRDLLARAIRHRKLNLSRTAMIDWKKSVNGLLND